MNKTICLYRSSPVVFFLFCASLLFTPSNNRMGYCSTAKTDALVNAQMEFDKREFQNYLDSLKELSEAGVTFSLNHLVQIAYCDFLDYKVSEDVIRKYTAKLKFLSFVFKEDTSTISTLDQRTFHYQEMYFIKRRLVSLNLKNQSHFIGLVALRAAKNVHVTEIEVNDLKYLGTLDNDRFNAFVKHIEQLDSHDSLFLSLTAVVSDQLLANQRKVVIPLIRKFSAFRTKTDLYNLDYAERLCALNKSDKALELLLFMININNSAEMTTDIANFAKNNFDNATYEEFKIALQKTKSK